METVLPRLGSSGQVSVTEAMPATRDFARPVKASLYSLAFVWDQLKSLLARASQRYWQSYATHELPSKFLDALTIVGGGVLGITLVSTPLRLWRALRNIGKHVF